MGIARYILIGLIATSGTAFAKPLLTSSEETMARLCLSQTESPRRIVDACDAALAEAGLTAAQRVELLISRGDGFLWMEDYDAAVAAYGDATDADPHSADAWNGLGWALRESVGDQEAFEAFETSLSIDVTVQGLSGMAATGRTSGRLSGDEAREMLQASLAIDPDYIWAHREIGWSLLDEGEAEGAMGAFRDALKVDPADMNARYGLGRAELSARLLDEALATFNQVLSDYPDNFATRVYRIVALRELDRNAQAVRDADRLIADYPARASGYIERGHALMALERRADAIQTYIDAQAVVGENNALLYWYADALATDGQFVQALEVIDRGLALSGADHSDFLLKSYIALELEDYETTRTAAEASLATGFEDPWAHYYVAISLVHSGETTQGLSRFETAMSTGLPEDRIGAFAKELISAGKFVEAAQLRLKY